MSKRASSPPENRVQVEILSGAEQDIQEVFNSLFDVSERKAHRLLTELDRVLGILSEHPSAGRRFGGHNARSINLHPFPLSLFYTATGSRIMVGAVLDMRLQPAHLVWQLQRRTML